MPFFRTILGDRPANEMGITYSHEHIVIDDCYATSTNPQFLLNDEKKIFEELQGLKALGCSTMVDTMPVNAGRNVLLSAGNPGRGGHHTISSKNFLLHPYPQ